jgi:probable HAF family extracellular repeat protein
VPPPAKWIWIIEVCLLAALAMPVWTAAQDNPSPDNKPKHKKYKLVDIGTFGGPASYVGGNGPGSTFLNNQGIVGGSANTTIPDVSHAFRWQNGVLTDLGALPGGNFSIATPINGLPWMVGFSDNGVIDPLLNSPAGHAVLWRNHQIIDLGTLGGNESAAYSGNSRGQIVGFSTNTIPDPFSEFGAQTHLVLWEKGAMRDLGTLGGPSITRFCNLWINEPGQIIGTSFINSIPNQNTGIPTADPFLWERGVMHDLGGLGGTIGAASGVNNRGQVTGTSDLAGDLAFHPFFWSRGTLTDVGTLGGDTGEARRQ